MQFDSNHDGRIGRTELTERMHSLLERGDVNADQVLDQAEILALARNPLVREPSARGLFPNAYSFGDEVGFSSRHHIEGAIEDLRLSSPRRETALAAAREYLSGHETAAATALLNDLQPLISSEELGQVRAILEARPEGASGEGIGGSAHLVLGDGRRMFFSHSAMSSPSALRAGAIELRLRAFAQPTLSAAEERAGTQLLRAAAGLQAALQRYDQASRLDADAQRALSDRMAGILTADENADFRAAIARRPVVAAGGHVLRVTATVPPPSPQHQTHGELSVNKAIVLEH
jgi:hypothetical protein